MNMSSTSNLKSILYNIWPTSYDNYQSKNTLFITETDEPYFQSTSRMNCNKVSNRVRFQLADNILQLIPTFFKVCNLLLKYSYLMLPIFFSCFLFCLLCCINFQ